MKTHLNASQGPLAQIPTEEITKISDILGWGMRLNEIKGYQIETGIQQKTWFESRPFVPIGLVHRSCHQLANRAILACPGNFE